MKSIGLISLPLLALLGCTSQQLTQSTCVVSHGSGFVGAGSGEEHITVAENGSPCVIAATIDRGNMGNGDIVTPPAHGQATVRTTVDATLISFTPTPGYVGEDSFEIAFGPDFKVTVYVQVVAVGSGSATTR